MTEQHAEALILTYIRGWKENNLEMILSPLAENCKIIESHGPTYHGINEIKRWFHFWLDAKSSVKQWNIFTFYYCKKKKSAFIEWEFIAHSYGKDYPIPRGTSIINYNNERINLIKEYRMTHHPYHWQQDKLRSE